MSQRIVPRKSEIVVSPAAAQAMMAKEQEQAMAERRDIVEAFDKEPRWDTAFVKPTGQKVVIAPDPLPRTSEGGIVLTPNSIKQFFTPTGVVLACGPDCKVVKPGDRVLWQGNLATGKIRYQEKMAIECKEEQLIGTVLVEHVPFVTKAEGDAKPGKIIT